MLINLVFSVYSLYKVMDFIDSFLPVYQIYSRPDLLPLLITHFLFHSSFQVIKVG